MPRNRVPSPQTMRILRALAAEPARWRYGYELGAQTGLKAGSLYPILVRLADRGLLDAEWEQSPPQGRPARHLYRLTTDGMQLAGAVGVAAVAGAEAPRKAATTPPEPAAPPTESGRAPH